MASAPNHHNDDERIGAVLNEVCDLRAAGNLPEAERLIAAYPDIADELRAHLRLLGEIRPDAESIADLIQQRVVRPADDPEFPAQLGPYKIRGVCGNGGMGVVLHAFEPALGREIALKVLRPALTQDPRVRIRFQREAQAAAKLQHPNVVTVYAADEYDGACCIAMECVRGPTLAHLIRAHGPLPTELARELMGQLLSGLRAAHAAGLIHRDIKPSNLLLSGFDPASLASSSPSSRRPGACPVASHGVPSSLLLKIADFGLARMNDGQTTMTAADAVLGTVEYMSPEQARGEPADNRDQPAERRSQSPEYGGRAPGQRGRSPDRRRAKIDHRTDLYSAGVVLYEMLTGRAPFRGDSTAATLHKVIYDRPPPPRRVNPRADRRLCALAEWLMEKRPADRPASADAALRALERGLRFGVGFGMRFGVGFGFRRSLLRPRLGWHGWLASAGLLAAGVWAVLYALAPRFLVDIPIKPGFGSDRVPFTYAWPYSVFWPNVFKPGYAVHGGAVADPFGDGHKLILLSQFAASRRDAVQKLYLDDQYNTLVAYGGHGRELWRYAFHQPHTWPDDDHPRAWWRSEHVVAADLDGQPGDEVLVVAGNYEQYARMLCLLDPRTRQVRQRFWHPGTVGQMLVVQDFIDGERPAILVRGCNNLLDGTKDEKAAGRSGLSFHDMPTFIALLDPLDMDGLFPRCTDALPNIQDAPVLAYGFIDMPSDADAWYDDLSESEQRRTGGVATEVQLVREMVPGHVPRISFKVEVAVEFDGTWKGRATLTLDRELRCINVAPHSTEPLESSPEYFWHCWKRLGKDSRLLED